MMSVRTGRFHECRSCSRPVSHRNPQQGAQRKRSSLWCHLEALRASNHLGQRTKQDWSDLPTCRQNYFACSWYVLCHDGLTPGEQASTLDRWILRLTVQSSDLLLQHNQVPLRSLVATPARQIEERPPPVTTAVATPQRHPRRSLAPALRRSPPARARGPRMAARAVVWARLQVFLFGTPVEQHQHHFAHWTKWV